jgi:hypothetical protein
MYVFFTTFWSAPDTFDWLEIGATGCGVTLDSMNTRSRSARLVEAASRTTDELGDVRFRGKADIS